MEKRADRNRVLVAVWVAALFIILTVPAPAAEPRGEAQSALISDWAWGVISDGVGPSNILVADLDGDGAKEVVAAAGGAPFILRHRGETYDTVAYGEVLPARSLAAADADGDGIQEVFAMASDGRLYALDGRTLKRLRQVAVETSSTDSYYYNPALAVGDTDGDGKLEAVVVTEGALSVFDAGTLALEWKDPAWGGTGVALPDLEGTGVRTILINGDVGLAIDGATHLMKWGYAGGFGSDMATGDVDGDGRDEIAVLSAWAGVGVLEGDTLQEKWSASGFDPQSVQVADVTGDGLAEVLLGEGQWGSVLGFNGTTGAQIWAIPNPEHGVFGIGVGDSDGDGVREVLWGAGLSSSGKDELFVGDWRSQSVKWEGGDLDGPFHAAVGDVDLDGAPEVVVVTDGSNSGYDGGFLFVLNAVTHRVKWSASLGDANALAVAVGQFDADPAPEILIATTLWYGNPALVTYDGGTGQKEWTSAAIGSGGYGAVRLLVAQVDGGGVDEILMAAPDSRIYIFRGASNVIEWVSPVLEGSLRDIDFADADGDGSPELLALTGQDLRVYEPGTWQAAHTWSVQEKYRVAVLGVEGAPLILLATGSGSPGEVTACDPQTLAQKWALDLSDYSVQEIVPAALAGDGRAEFMVLGSTYYSSFPKGYLSVVTVGADGVQSSWVSKDRWGTLYEAALGDLVPGGSPEVVLGASSLFAVCHVGEAAPPCILSCEGSASPPKAHAGTEVTFAASATAQGCPTNISYFWEFGDGSTGEGATCTHTYAANYNWTVDWTLHVLSGDEECTKTGSVEVLGPCDVSCNAGTYPQSGPAPLAVRFTAYPYSYDCLGDPSYSWDFGDGGTSQLKEPLHAYTAEGTYTWTLTISQDGATCQGTGTITVYPLGCTLACSAQVAPSTGSVPLAVLLRVQLTATGCAASPVAKWDFGDGQSATGTEVTHAYTIPGSYAWAVAVTADAATCLKSGIITVSTGIPGDCDGDGQVSIGEVQKAINMFLGSQAPACGADFNGDGSVSIGEVQKVINAFLGVVPKR